MDSQFSVSVELTKLVPFVPLVKLASQGALTLVRSLSKTGSDLVVEHDLAAMFGRLRIEEHFARTFKTAVTVSKIHPIAAGLEIVLQAGAGPTVVHAVQQAPFFSMLVQLSALLWAHDATYLARCLLKIMTDKKQGNSDDVPDEIPVVGTLRCIREQTCGYLWILEFLAIQTILIEEVGLLPQDAQNQAIDKVVLATLIEGLPMLQSLPEDRSLLIRTKSGLSTIILWAFKILGLSVDVAKWDDSSSSFKRHQFGPDTPGVIIRFMEIGDQSSAVVLNRTNDLIFESSHESLEAVGQLWPSHRHTLAGFGEAYWRKYVHLTGLSPRPLSTFALEVAQNTLISAERARNAARERVLWKAEYFPSSQKIIAICMTLFPTCMDASSLEQWSNNSQIHDTQEKTITSLKRHLSNFMLSLCFLDNIELCEEAPLSLDLSVNGPCDTTPQTYRHAFDIIERALQAPEGLDTFQRNAVSAVSAWGWTLLLHCVTTQNPSLLQPGMALVRGVPSRNGVQRRFILDWAMEDMASQFVSEDISARQHGPFIRIRQLRYEIVGREGDTVILDGRDNPNPKIDYFVGNGRDGFIVYKQIGWPKPNSANGEYNMRIGFRQVQEALWNSLALPSCNCKTFSAGDAYKLTSHTWVFRGMISDARRTDFKADNDPWSHQVPETPSSTQIGTVDQPVDNEPPATDGILRDAIKEDRKCRIHISQTAGHEDTRLVQLLDSFRRDPATMPRPIHSRVLRCEDVCVSCAVAYLRKNIAGESLDKPYHISLIV
ncbi:MAG: hypothetical protein GOMPHAMPRED_004788 [Gomphillus americanus]|uniref:Uncharacterized protein n=1 Tax=Gomphillus americanus TaxID=1940652 RepID=A0A8H3ELA5_9LECA|nr:MAG: hypothetical protein GOMPHAMPRED_004788 [Gomphillus americanus]